MQAVYERKLHNEELNDLYCSANTVLVIKSRRMRWAGHVACMGERRGVYRVLVGKLEGIDGRTILRWIFREWDVDWVEVTQDRDRCRALVNAVMSLRVP